MAKDLDDMMGHPDARPKTHEFGSHKFVVSVLQCDAPSLNGNVFPRDVVQKSIDEYMQLPKERRLGPVQSNGTVNLIDVSFIVEDAVIDENGMLNLHISTLPNINGEALFQLIKSGLGTFSLGKFGVGFSA